MKTLVIILLGALTATVLVDPASANAYPPPSTCEVVLPQAGDDFVTTSRNTSVTFSPLWNDSDTPAQDLVSFGQPSHGTVVSVGVDALRYTPDPGYVGSDSFSYLLGGCLQCYEGGCTEPEFAEATVHISVN